jgi:hypothetical protein
MKEMLFFIVLTVSVTLLFPQVKLTFAPPSSAEVKNVWSCTSTPPYDVITLTGIKIS